MTDIKFKHGSKKHILNTYANLVKGKLTEHWVWVALERIANGEDEAEVLMDYGYIRIPAGLIRGGVYKA